MNFARKAQGALPCPARGTCPPRSSSAMLRAPSLPADIRPQFPRGTPAQGPGREGAEMAPLQPPTPTPPRGRSSSLPPGPPVEPRFPRGLSALPPAPRGQGEAWGLELASALPLSAPAPTRCLPGSGEAASRRARRLTEDAAGGGRRGFRLGRAALAVSDPAQAGFAAKPLWKLLRRQPLGGQRLCACARGRGTEPRRITVRPQRAAGEQALLPS